MGCTSVAVRYSGSARGDDSAFLVLFDWMRLADDPPVAGDGGLALGSSHRCTHECGAELQWRIQCVRCVAGPLGHCLVGGRIDLLRRAAAPSHRSCRLPRRCCRGASPSHRSLSSWANSAAFASAVLTGVVAGICVSVFFGAIVGFSAYIYLLSHSSPQWPVAMRSSTRHRRGDWLAAFGRAAGDAHHRRFRGHLAAVR